MPGLSSISAILRCNNERVLNPEKTRTFTYDATLVVGFQAEEIIEGTAILNHYVAPNEEPFIDNAFYKIYGKVASIDSSYKVGDGLDPNNYQFVIDADTVCNCKYRSVTASGAHPWCV
jgi:hypothetical protein